MSIRVYCLLSRVYWWHIIVLYPHKMIVLCSLHTPVDFVCSLLSERRRWNGSHMPSNQMVFCVHQGVGSCSISFLIFFIFTCSFLFAEKKVFATKVGLRKKINTKRMCVLCEWMCSHSAYGAKLTMNDRIRMIKWNTFVFIRFDCCFLPFSRGTYTISVRTGDTWLCALWNSISS